MLQCRGKGTEAENPGSAPVELLGQAAAEVDAKASLIHSNCEAHQNTLSEK
jgi:hypothetical protein